MSRAASDGRKVHEFMRFFGERARGGRVYLAGGASAVIVGWRELTVDVDIKLDPEPDRAFETIARAKEVLDINVELAAPDDFIPALPGWRDRSTFIARYGATDFLHYDFNAQALSKIARGYVQDQADVAAMYRLRLIEPGTLLRLFDAVEPEIQRYPAIDPVHFREQVESTLASFRGDNGKDHERIS